MTWVGAIVLGLGVLLVVGLGAGLVWRLVDRRSDGTATSRTVSYAERLDPDGESGVWENGSGAEINRMAEELIREHGAGAVIEAARQAIAKLADDDRKGQAVWQQVLESAMDSQRRDERRHGAAE